MNSKYIPFVYAWMFVGLVFTSVSAWLVSSGGSLFEVFYQNTWAIVAVFFVQLVLVALLAAASGRIPSLVGGAIFLVYSFLTGVMVGSVFLKFTLASIASVFLITAAMFLVVSLWGYLTKRDLSSLGSVLFLALVGLIIASVVNIWLQSPILNYVASYAGILIFCGLTAHDTQKLKEEAWELKDESTEIVLRRSLVGAMSLYLDLINLFLLLINLFGEKK